MALLFRLTEEGGFYSWKDVENYFNYSLIECNKYYFYHTKKYNIKRDDNIYFVFKNFMVAKAIFDADNIYENMERTNKFCIGYKVRNIKLISNSLKLDNDIIGYRQIYLTKEMENEILKSSSLHPDEIEDNKEYSEGLKKRVVVNAYERDRQARQKCIEKYGYKCSVCEMEFEKIYGEIGKNFIHVHHIKPLAEIKKKYKVNPLEDLIPVCPNCHAMLHRMPYSSVDGLKKLLKK